MAKQMGISWPQICDGKGAGGAVPKLYNIEGTPLLYLLDRGGNIVLRMNSAKGLEPLVSEVLAKHARPAWTARDGWQRPVATMEALGVRAGSKVADVGSGEGYFTFHLAALVGAQGKVHAVDLDEKALAKLHSRAEKEKLVQIEITKGADNDPHLPAEALDAILIVDSYHEFVKYDDMLTALYAALKPGGKLGILDQNDVLSRPRSEYGEQHRLPAELVIEEARRHGFRLEMFEPQFAGQPGTNRSYLVVFEKR